MSFRVWMGDFGSCGPVVEPERSPLLQADIQHLSYVTTCCPAAVTGLGDHGGFLPTHVIHFQLLGSKELQSRELLHVSASKYD